MKLLLKSLTIGMDGSFDIEDYTTDNPWESLIQSIEDILEMWNTDFFSKEKKPISDDEITHSNFKYSFIFLIN